MLEQLNKLYEDKYLIKQTHPSLPLTIWNYSNSLVYEDLWDDLTVRCRGLVTDNLGNIVNNPIPKFWNWQEQKGKYACNFKKPFTTMQKMDGSLIQAFWYNDKIVVCSRGSFQSEQAKWAEDILLKNYVQYVEKGYTYCFELIHPENRIVVNYKGVEDLVLIAIRDDQGDLDLAGYADYFNVVNQIELDISKYKDLKDLHIPNDEEGFVIRFENGNRVKIKGAEYCRLHKICTNTTSYSVWESLKAGDNLQAVAENVPDEWLSWYYKKIGELYSKYTEVYNKIEWDWNAYFTEDIYLSRKEAAEYIKTCKYPAEMFAKLDNKDYINLIWDKLKPPFEKANYE